MARSREEEVVEQPQEEKKYKIIEKRVDGNLTVRRFKVPIDTTEEDISPGDRLIDSREADGILARAQKREEIRVGDRVRLRPVEGTDPDPTLGTVEAMLTSGKIRVAWEGRSKSKHEPDELNIVW